MTNVCVKDRRHINSFKTVIFFLNSALNTPTLSQYKQYFYWHFFPFMVRNKILSIRSIVSTMKFLSLIKQYF